MGEELRILILEERPADAELMERELRRAGIAFVSRRAETKETFLAELADFAPDIVLSDYMMPQFTGGEALELVKERFPSVPLIIVTGSMNEETTVECMKNGAADCVIRERLARLGPAVRAALKNRRVREENRRAEESMRRSAREWSSTFDAMNDAICLLDLEGKIVRCNVAMRDMFGKSWQEIIGRPCWELVHGSPGPIETCPYVRMRETRRRESSVLEANGRWLDVTVDPLTVDPLTNKSKRLTGAVHVISDITERRSAEQALRESAEKYRTLIEAANDAIFVADVQTGIVLEANRRAEELLDLPAEQIVGMHQSELHPKEDLERSAETFREHAEGKGAISELSVRRRDRTRVPVEISASVVEVGGKRIVQGIFRDLTERKRAEEALRASEERYQRITEAITDYIYTVRVADGRAAETTHGPGCLAVTGYRANEFANDSFLWFRMVAAEDRPEVEEQARRILAGEDPPPIEHRLVRKNGTVRWVRNTFVPHRDKHGALAAYDGLIQDITERKRAEEALRESEAKYRTLVENIPQKIFMKDRDFKYLSVNESFARDLGIGPADVAGKTDYSFFPKDLADKYRADDQRIMESGQTDDLEEKYLQEGKETWVHTIKTPVRDENGEIVAVLGIFWDITARKRGEEERRNLEAQLRQQQRLESIGTLAGGVAHEINNPINGIMNYAQLVADRMAPDDASREYAVEIIHETERVTAIVRNLLAFARQEKQRHSPARMADIVSATLFLIQSVMRHDQIALQVDAPEDLPEIKCRSQQIQQVLMNLLTNARDALNERYPGYDADKMMRITVRTIEKEGAPWVRTTVEDHGVGIPPEIRDRLFDPFFTTKGRDKGTGLGLSVSHGIVRDHGGELLVECEPGRYTRFHLDLRINHGWSLDGSEADTADSGEG